MTIGKPFRQTFKLLGTVGGLLASIASASATEQLFACTLMQGSFGLLLSEADQMAVDVENQTVDLQVASTIGSNFPEDWRFGPGKTTSGNESFSVKRIGSSIIGAGIHDAAAHAFELEGGILTWTMVMMHESMTMSWRCNESLMRPPS